MRWYPSSKSYASSMSDSNQESATLQSKVSSQPNGVTGNGYAIVSKNVLDYVNTRKLTGKKSGLDSDSKLEFN